MATITNNRYTDNGITYDARTGQQVNDTGLTPTPVQMDNRAAAVATPVAPVTPAIAPTPADRGYTDPSSPNYQSALDSMFAEGGIFGDRTAPTEDEQAKVREQQRSAVQAQIDAVQEMSALELQLARERATQRLGRNRAMLSATGQLGSGSETTAIKGVEDVNTAEERAVLAAKAEKIAQIESGIETRSRDIIDKEKTLATTNAEAYLNFLTTASDRARKDMTDLATAGVELSPEKRDALAEQSGYDPQTFDALYQSLRIANSADYINKDKPNISADGKTATFFKLDKKTGAITAENISLPGGMGADPKNVDIISRKDGLYVVSKIPNADGTYTTKKVADAEPPEPGSNEADKWLTVEEAAKLGVPYGTKRGEATGKTMKKPMSTQSVTDLTQAQIALNNVNRIAELVGELGTQGPVLGRFRSANPYDTRVVELNNLLTQTVPGLARGIFKEVGVLTDTDINRYMQTLANTKLTKEQADNATEQLLKSIKYSIKTQLETLDKSGRDVREFDDLRELVGGGAPTDKGNGEKSTLDVYDNPETMPVGGVYKMADGKYVKKLGPDQFEPVEVQ